MTETAHPVVTAVCRDGQHRSTEPVADGITVLEGLGVEGDAHAGVTVQHRSRVAADPTQPNLRQVHLIHALPKGTVLRLGPQVVVEVTGLRNPCNQINDFRPGMLKAVLDKDEQGRLVRKAGIMGIVLRGGPVKPGDNIRVDLPEQPHQPLNRYER